MRKNTNVDIVQLTASDICNEVNTIDFKNKYIYSGSLPDSLMLRKLRMISKKSEFYSKGIHEFTNVVIDVDLFHDAEVKLDTSHEITIKSGKDKDKKILVADKKRIATAKAMRKRVYNKGFVIVDSNTNVEYEYVDFERSSSKSKNGHSLFILKKYYDEMIKWARLQLIFSNKEIADIASLRAYESLTCSAIEDVMTINPNNILLIDDIEGECQELQSVTTVKEIKEGNKTKYVECVKNKMMDIHNSIWDGQSLGDSSLFEQKKIKGKQQGFYLLRNHMLKSAMFNAEIQAYYKDNNISTVYNKFGEKMAAEDVLVITTPNSCKFFKFSDKIAETVLGKKEASLLSDHEKEKIAWDYWKDNIDEIFGICQTEHESKHVDGNWTKMTYQFINTMPFSYSDIEDLSKYSVDYSNLLASHVSEFRKYIGADKMDNGKNMMYNLLSINDKVQYTKMYYDFRHRVRNDYRKELSKGRILSEGDYSVLVSCPYEMLRSSIGEKITKESLLHHRIDVENKPNEYIYPIYCNGYEDKKELSMFRNPHICAGNVAVVQNIHREEFDIYFPNFNKNIVVIDAFDCGIFDRLQGCDVDSDKVAIFESQIILKRAKECLKFPTPVNCTTAEKKLRRLNGDQKAIVDNIIADNAIGKIVNASMVYNSYFWYYTSKNSNGKYDKKLNELYDAISVLSSLSQIEIDKSKKLFAFRTSVILKNLTNKNLVDECDMYIAKKRRFAQDFTSEENVIMKVLKDKKNKLEKGTEEYKTIQAELNMYYYSDIKKPKQPEFFKSVFENKKDVEYFDMKCPMNDLLKILKHNIKKAYKPKNENGNIIEVKIKDVIVDIPLADANVRQIKVFEKIAISLKKMISEIYAGSEHEDNKEIALKVKNIKEKALEEVSNKKVLSATIAAILYRRYAKEDFKYIDNAGRSVDYGMMMMSLLSRAYPDEFLNAIQYSEGEITELIEWKDGEIEKFGRNYTEVDTNFYESKSEEIA